MDGIQVTRQSLRILAACMMDLKVNPVALEAGFAPGVFATDRALDMARDGIPFREAYRTAATQGADISAEAIAQSLANRVSAGGCGKLETVLLQSRLEALKN